MKTTREAKLVEFGLGGDTVHWAKSSRTSGYGCPENPHAAMFAGKEPAPDGCPVVDKREAVQTKAGRSLAICGPLVNVDLAAGERKSCPEPSPMFAEALADNAYGGLLTLQAAARSRSTLGPLDEVGLSAYVAGWRAVGARIGHYRDGAIVWETEGIQK